MNTLRIFTPSVFKTFSNDVLDRFFVNGDDQTGYNGHYSNRPSTNIIEKEDKFNIEMALPGYSKEQINMTFHEDILTVSGNVEDYRQDGMKYLTREFEPKNFERRFTIQKSLDADNISAEFKNGILTISIPKKVKAKEKVTIQVPIS